MKKVLSYLLLCTMLLTMLPSVQFFADDEPTPLAEYVTRGLVSLYRGTGHDAADNVWEDEWGTNDITGMDPTANSYFTEDGYLLSGEERTLPTQLLSVLKGNEFTFEMLIGDTAAADLAVNNYIAYIANNAGTTAEKFAVYVQVSKGSADKLCVKTSGVASGSRPTVGTNGTAEATDSTLTVTFREGGLVSFYVNGILRAETAAPVANGNNASSATRLTIGSTDSVKLNTTVYRGFRFYTKALTANEVAYNYAVDCGETPEAPKTLGGDYITRGLVSLYNGVGKLPTDTVWADEWGNNDITGLSTANGAGFTDEGWYSNGTRHSLPTALLEPLSGDEFTFEMRLGDVAAHAIEGQNYITLIANNGGATTEYFAIYLLVNKGTSDKFYVKTSGISSGSRPCVAEGGTELAANSTITVTFKAGGKCCLYADGVLMASANAPASNGNLLSKMTRFDFGEDNVNKWTDVLYKGFRFYETELSAAEVAHNYAADGTIHPIVVKTTDYVQDGLVSLYEGGDHGSNATVWQDNWGENPITGLTESDTNYFTEDGYHLCNAQYTLPMALLDVLKGEEYTVELSMGDIVPADPAVNNYIPFMSNLGTEMFALFLQLSKGTSDILMLKTSGLGTSSRPKVSTGGLELSKDSTITVSFKAGGLCCLYVDGQLLSYVNAPATNGNNIANATSLILGNASSGKQYTALFKGIRFYDRQLTAGEVAKNAWIDHPDLTVATDYVQDGLVSLYSGTYNTRYGHDTDSLIWYDLKGANNIPVAKTDTNYFTENAFHLERAQYEMPAALLDVVNGDNFTVEMALGDFETIAGTSFSTFLNTIGNDSFALFLRTSGDYIEFKNGGNARPKMDGGEEFFRDSTVSVTFEKGGLCNLYVDGFLITSSAATANLAATGPFIFGHSDSARVHIADYKSLRFYNRALSAEEIVANATVDGNYDPDRPVSQEFARIEQPETNLIGDIAFIETAESADELAAILAAEVKPSTVIVYVNDALALTDASGENTWSTVEDFFTALDGKFIPTFYVTDEDTVEALCDYLEYNIYEDVTIISPTPALIKHARETYPIVRGYIDLSGAYSAPLSVDDLSAIRRLVNSNYSKNVILPWQFVTKADVDWLIDRGTAPMLKTAPVSETVPALDLLLSGTYGIVCDRATTAFLYETSETYLLPGTLSRTVVNVGHRGYPTNDHPENTIESFRAAYEAGAEMVELDIYITTDGEIAVIHNATTSIFNRSISVEGSTMAQLKEVYIERNGNRFYLPSLREVFEEFKNTDLRFMIEIKSSKASIVPALKALIEEYEEDYDMYDRCTVISYGSTGQYKNMQREYPEMSFALLNSAISAADGLSAAKQIQKLVQGANSYIAPEYVGYTDDYVRETQMRGIMSSVYTLSSTTTIYPNLLHGVSTITGNTPQLFAKLPKTLARNPEISGEIPMNTRYQLPMIATNWNGAEADVGNKVNIQVISGDATVDGSYLIANSEGDITLLVGYTYQLDNYGSYTIYAEPFTVTAVRSVGDRTAENLNALTGVTASFADGDLHIGLDATMLGYCLGDQGIADMLTAAAPLFDGANSIVSGVRTIYADGEGMTAETLSYLYVRQLFKLFREPANFDGTLMTFDQLTYRAKGGYNLQLNVIFELTNCTPAMLDDAKALLGCFTVSSSKTDELFAIDLKALLALYPDMVCFDGMTYSEYAAANGPAAAYGRFCSLSFCELLNGIASRTGERSFGDYIALKLIKAMNDVGCDGTLVLAGIETGYGSFHLEYVKERSLAAKAAAYAAYGDGDYFAAILGDEVIEIPVVLNAVIATALPGDVNGDGVVSIADVSTLLSLLGGSDPADFVADSADLDLDDSISIRDVSLLLSLISE